MKAPLKKLRTPGTSINVVSCEIHGMRDVHGESLLEMTVKNIGVEARYH